VILAKATTLMQRGNSFGESDCKRSCCSLHAVDMETPNIVCLNSDRLSCFAMQIHADRLTKSFVPPARLASRLALI